MTAPDFPRRFDYTPRRLGAFSQGYSFFVRILKFTLPLAALVIVGILITRLTGEPAQNLASIPKEEKTTPGQVELVGAKYEGEDDQGRPYTVTADKATRAMDAPDSVLFENPVADITLQDKTWVAVRGKNGVFDRTTETLDMRDDVTVFHDSGYEMHLQNLHISLKQKAASSTLPVQAQGPMGIITAQNMSVEDQGDLIVFGGPATLTIFRISSGKERG